MMASASRSLSAISWQPSTAEFALDPRKSLSDYRCEIYDLLQYLDEQQENIEKQLARFTSHTSTSTHKQSTRRHPSSANSKRDEDGAVPAFESESESEEEDDFVVVKDINAPHRKKQLLNQLQQLWRTRDALRKRAKQLNVRIDSLAHGKGSGLMPVEDLLQNGVEVQVQDDGYEA